jgi:hypothetical protein
VPINTDNDKDLDLIGFGWWKNTLTDGTSIFIEYRNGNYTS